MKMTTPGMDGSRLGTPLPPPPVCGRVDLEKAGFQLLCFFFIAVFAYRPNDYMPKDWQHDPEFMDTTEWPPFFHMPVLMLMLITLLNDGTLITIGYDLAVAPKTPPIWNMPFLFSMAFVQSFVAMISSVNLLHILLHSWDEGSMMRSLGLGGVRALEAGL